MSNTKKMSLAKDVETSQKLYINSNPKSLQCHTDAKSYLPGGNTRSVLHNGPFPTTLLKGESSKVYDVDGHEYIDFVGEMSAGIYGHSHPVITKAIKHVVENIGLSLGGTTPYEQDLAREITKRIKSMESVRFCNSGTEANIQCLLAAKFFSKRTKFICMKGGYHGGPLVFSPGNSVYNINHQDFILCEYNNLEEFDRVFEENRETLAGVITEGMLGAGGCVIGKTEFLKGMERKCKQLGVIFILDEVMTSRLHYGGLQLKLELDPDITSLGKYIGGGFSVGAFGGRLDIMEAFNPLSEDHLHHSGTFNNNTMTMYVGYQGLSKVYTEKVAELLNLKGDLLRQRLSKLMQGTMMSIIGQGSTMTIHFTNDGECFSYKQVSESAKDENLNDLKNLFWFDMVALGYWIAHRGMINLNVALTDSEIEEFAQTVENWISRRRSLIEVDNNS